MPAIEISHLNKRYKKFTALHDVSLTVQRGTVLGILGPNGAGKTTLIKSLIGSIAPTSGTILVQGLDPLANKWKLRKVVGYMPQEPSLYETLTPFENISFFGKGTNASLKAKSVEDIIAFLELEQKAHMPVFALSGGQKKRVSLACALVNKPEILFLDEPTAAVDPYLKMKSWGLFRQLASEGTTLIISTHLMDEAMLCDELIILREGLLIAYDTPEHIIQNGTADITIKEGEEKIEHIANTPASLAEKLHAYGLRESVESVSLKEQNLEDIIIAITSKKQE